MHIIMSYITYGDIFRNTMTVDIDVEITDTVDNLKAKIQEMKGITPIDQRLTFGGKQLEKGNTLANYHIQKESTLEMMQIGGRWFHLEDELRYHVKRHILNKKICRKCYSRLPMSATNCRKRKCRSTDLRKRHGRWVG